MTGDDSSIDLEEVDVEKLLYERIGTKENGERLSEVASAEMDYMASQLDIDESVQQVGEAIYRRSLRQKFIENRTVGDVSAASLYAACRVESKAFDQKTFAHTARGTTLKSFSRTYAEISQQLELKTGPISPEKYISRLVTELGLSDEVEETAEDIIQVIEEDEPEYLSGKTPVVVAAAAVYSASLLENEMRSQREVANAANVSEKPIRVHYQSQVEILDLHGYIDLDLS